MDSEEKKTGMGENGAEGRRGEAAPQPDGGVRKPEGGGVADGNGKTHLSGGSGEEAVPTVPGWAEIGGEEEAAAECRAEEAGEGLAEKDAAPPRLRGRGPAKAGKSRALRKPEESRQAFTGEEKLLILDVLGKSKLNCTDFSMLVGISNHTLYAWKKKFEEEGPEGLLDLPRGPKGGSRVDAASKRAILMLKESHPEYGCERISDMLYRGPGIGVCAGAVGRVLKEEGYEAAADPAAPHPDKVRSFERAKPNELWQSDFFTFILKRQGQRVHLVAFMDDYSRFITGFGLSASASTTLVIEVIRASIGAWGPPEEVLTDQGPQYHTWRGKSAFTKEMEKRGIKQIVARARHPQTLGKIERFWGTLWRECVETAVFLDLDDARKRIGFFVDHYNFRRTHQALDGMVPADRFFSAGSEIRKTLEARVAANPLDIARNGMPRKTFYLAGRVGDVDLSVHTEGERVVLTTCDGRREEVDLRAPGKRAEEGQAPPEEIPGPVGPQGRPLHENTQSGTAGPGESPLDEGLDRLEKGIGKAGEEA